MPIQLSGSLVITGSITTTGGITISGSILSASYSDTASFSNNFRVLGNLTASTALVTGTLTAQTLVVQTVTSSIVYSSGSNLFGSVLSDRQTFTGSVNITGSLTVNTTGTEFQVTNAGVVMGNLLTDNHRITGSVNISGSLSGIGANFSGDIGIGTTSPQRQLTINSSFPALQLTNPTTGTTSNDGLLIFQSGLNGTISNQESGSLSFETNNTFRAIITSGGNIGIGATTPLGILEVRGTNRAVSADGILQVNSNDTQAANVGGSISFGGSYIAASSITEWAQISGRKENSTSSQYGGYLSLATRPHGGVNTERMRIISTGQVQIKQADDSHSGGFSLINAAVGSSWNFVNGGDNNLYFGYQGVSKGVFNTAGVYTALSDINKKKDFEESTIGLSAILGLKPTLYRMKEEDESAEKQLGFIAQEVKEFIPQAYIEQIDGERTFIGLQDRPIISALVKAIQELSAKVTALETK